jgi:hypothetical protein
MSLRWSSATDQLYAVSNSSPSLDLDFASNKSLLDNISGNNLVTFRRASTGTYVDSDGLIKTSPVNLLYNTTTYSNWINSGQSIQTNAAISPSGLNDAVKLVADASAGGKLSYRSATTTATNVCSVYAKAGEYTNIQLRELSAARFYVNFDLSAGTYAVPQSGSAPAGGFDFISADIQDVGNGWYRCIVVNSRVGGIAFSIAGYPDSATVTTSNPNFTGDGTSGVYIWGAQLEEGTTATDYIPTGATISGAPRFDHDPATGESLGLLIEEERSNLVEYSEQFGNWVAPSTAIGNTTTSPSGGTAVGVDSTTCSTITVTDPSSITFSCYAKAGSSDYVYLRTVNWGTLARVWFNLADGSTGSVSSPSSNITNVTSTDAGDGWYRISFQLDSTGDNVGNLQITATDADLNINQVGYVFAWGAQVETGSFPTSYIPTTSSTVTRAADVASIEGTNFSSWYNQSEGTMFAEAKSVDGVNGVFSVGSTTDPIGGLNYDYNGFNGQWQGGVMDGTFNPVDGSFHKFALTATTTSNTLFTDGNQQDTAVATSSNVGVNLIVGNRSLYGGIMSSTHYLNGHISRLTYYPYRLSDTILQEITS